MKKELEHKYHFIWEIGHLGDVVVLKIASKKTLADPFTITLPNKIFESHLEVLGLKYMSHLLKR